MKGVFKSVKILTGVSLVALCDGKEEPKLSRAELKNREAEALDKEQEALFGANYAKL